MMNLTILLIMIVIAYLMPLLIRLAACIVLGISFGGVLWMIMTTGQFMSFSWIALAWCVVAASLCWFVHLGRS